MNIKGQILGKIPVSRGIGNGHETSEQKAFEVYVDLDVSDFSLDDIVKVINEKSLSGLKTFLEPNPPDPHTS